jgi:hypothetical protein
MDSQLWRAYWSDSLVTSDELIKAFPSKKWEIANAKVNDRLYVGDGIWTRIK